MASSATFHSASFIFRKPAPHTGVLATLESPLQTFLTNIAAHANLLGFFDLCDCRASISDREEEFRIHIATCSAMTPIHRHLSSSPQSSSLEKHGCAVRSMAIASNGLEDAYSLARASHTQGFNAVNRNISSALNAVMWRPRQDSNLCTRLRRAVLYPLSYGGVS